MQNDLSLMGCHFNMPLVAAGSRTKKNGKKKKDRPESNLGLKPSTSELSLDQLRFKKHTPPCNLEFRDATRWQEESTQ